MENGNGSFEERVHLGEVNGLEDGSRESRLGNGESRVSDDNETRDSEADEVFEEALEGDVNISPRHEEEVEKEQKKSDVKFFAADGNANDENFDERIANGDPQSGHEMEHFEEAMEDVPTSLREKIDTAVDSDAGFHSVGAAISDGTAAPIETNGMEIDDIGHTKKGDHVEQAPKLHVNGAAKSHLDENLPEKRIIFEDENFQSMKSNSPDILVHEKSENGASDHMENDGVASEEGTVEVPVLRVDEEMRTPVGAKQSVEGFESENDNFDGADSSITCFLVDKKSENEVSEVKVDKNGPHSEFFPGKSENEESVVKADKIESPSKIVLRSSENEESDVKVDNNEKPSQIVCSEQVCSSVNVDFDKQIPHHDQKEKVEEKSIGAGSDNDEKIDKSQVETSLSEGELVEETSVIADGNTDLEVDISKEEASLSEGEIVEVMSDAADSNSDQKIEKTLEEKDTPQASSLENSAVNRLSEGDTVSVEEYDEASSSDKENTQSINGASSGKPADALPARPAGLGSSAPLLGPPSRVSQQPRANGTMQHQQAQTLEESANGETEEYDETREKLQMIRVKFLRLAHRLGQTPHNVVVAQVLYRLGLAEQLRGSRTTSRAGAFSFDRASAMAVQLEAAGQEALDFSCTIMVLGKTGVGKSATINSIFDESRFTTDAFQRSTKKVQDITGTVQGIKVRVIDTPGLSSSSTDQCQNEKILHSVKRFIKKTPPDIVLYLDRLDMQSRDFGDVPLLRTITDVFGPSIWFNAIVVLTHAASAPPDGPNGTPLSYEMFVTQRSHVVQQAIRQAAGDQRLMNPVSLVENHSACRTNRAGQRVLPNGQVWKPQLLLLSFASKILAEANTLLKLQDSPPGKPFGTRSRVPPLPFLLSSLLQSRPQLKLPEEQFGDDDNIDEDLDEASDSEAESEYDELPPFKRLTKSQMAKLSKAQKKAYYDELEYREKLFMKKQLKEEKRRKKLLKKMAEAAKELPSDYNENEEEENGGAASVPVPMPDLALPTSFDSDNPTHRYRYLDSSNQWLVRPVLENHGWDHDVGYEGINVERLFVVNDKIPVSCSGQVVKDKKECNLQMEVASSVKHGEGKATSAGLEMQTVGKDLAYTFRSETKFSNFRRNKMAAGLSLTMLGEALTAGVKLEDVLMLHKRLRVVMTGGAMSCRGDVACGGSLEATLRDQDYPLGRTLSTLGLSVMDWHGDLAIGCNINSQFPVGRNTNMVARANLNNKGAGQVSLRLSSSEQLQIALVALVPLIRNVMRLSGFYSEDM